MTTIRNKIKYLHPQTMAGCLQDQHFRKILDVGCGNGNRTIETLCILNKNCSIVGIDSGEHGNQHFDVKDHNLEEGLPYEIKQEKFDLVIANQILEHLKNIDWLISDIYDVLDKDGLFLVGVPNLAGLHNRFLLMVGRQPACIKVESTHIRGFTYHAFRKYLESFGFGFVNFRGCGLYMPFLHNSRLVNLFPGCAVYLFLLMRKV